MMHKPTIQRIGKVNSAQAARKKLVSRFETFNLNCIESSGEENISALISRGKIIREFIINDDDDDDS